MEENNQKEKKDRLLPFSIIFAAILIASSFIYSAGRSDLTRDSQFASTQQPAEDFIVPSPDNIFPVTEDDNIRGNLNAPVKVVEFSDFECIFCKNFHSTMKMITEEYEGQVAWVYRHFITGLFFRSERIAIASECVAEQGGNDAFWAFADEYFSLAPSSDMMSMTEVFNIVEKIGLDKREFDECRASDRYMEKIQRHTENGAASGAEGTPYSVVIGSDGETYVINGNQSPEVVRLIIDRALGF